MSLFVCTAGGFIQSHAAQRHNAMHRLNPSGRYDQPWGIRTIFCTSAPNLSHQTSPQTPSKTIGFPIGFPRNFPSKKCEVCDAWSMLEYFHGTPWQLRRNNPRSSAIETGLRCVAAQGALRTQIGCEVMVQGSSATKLPLTKFTHVSQCGFPGFP